MPDSPSVSEKLRSYLRDLAPGARTQLFMAIERARATGDVDAILEMVLRELTAVALEKRERPPRVPTPHRLFLEPVEDFLIDELLPTKIHGRIARPALEAIWTWIERDVAPAEIDALEAAIREHLASGATDFAPLTGDVAGHFRDGVIARIRRKLEPARESSDARRKLAGHVGGQRNYQELEDVVALIGLTREIDAFLADLPAGITASDPEQCAAVVKRMTDVSATSSRMAWYAAVAVHDRVDTPARIPAMAVAAMGTMDVKLIAAAPVGRLVDVVVSDIERFVHRIVTTLDTPTALAGVIQPLKDYNTYARNLRAALELDDNPCEWSRRLTEIRTRLSDRLGKEFAELPGLLRRSLKSVRGFAGRTPQAPDPIDVDRARAVIEIFDVARLAAGELALNEVLQRLRGEIEGYVETTTGNLTNDLRQVYGETREAVLGHAAAAVRFNEVLFGHAQASLVRRAFEVAAGGAIPQLRAAS